MNKPFLFACLMLLGVAFYVDATEPVLSSEDILAQQRGICADMDARTDRYVDMPRSTRKAIRADQDRLAVLLEGKADTSQLDPATSMRSSACSPASMPRSTGPATND